MGIFERDENDTYSRQGRLVLGYIFHFIYSILITYKMFKAITDAGKGNDGFYAGFGVWTLIVFACQIVVLIFSLKGRYVKSVNIVLLTFILSTMIQYAIGLYYSHVNVKMSTPQDRSSCVNLKSDMVSYIIYLTTLPMIVFTNILYPYPTEEQKWMTSIQNGFSMLDFLDMAELIFSDVGCYSDYTIGWLVVFWISIGASTILITTKRGLEQRKDNDETHTWVDFSFTFLNMTFNDVMFCVLRILVMAKEGHVYFGLIFVIKEFLTLGLRFCLLDGYVRRRIEDA